MPRKCVVDKIQKYVQIAIDQVNSKAVSNAQLIRKWTFLPQDFSIESGELTPTHKVKRKIINQKYAKIIEKMYLIGKF